MDRDWLSSCFPLKSRTGETIGLLGAVLEVSARRRAEDALRQTARELGERVKELRCLYTVSSLLQQPKLPRDELYRATAQTLAAAYQYPEICCVRLTVEGRQYTSDAFAQSSFRQVAEVSIEDEHVVSIEVFYREARPAAAEGPFLKEERELLDTVAAAVARSAKARAERAAHRASEQRYRDLFEVMADAYALHEIILDAQGVPRDYRFLEVNPAFETMLGLRREQVVGKTVLELMPDTEPLWIARYGEVALSGKAVRFEQYAGHFDRRFEVSVTSPQRGLFAAIFSDVTERRRAERAVREREEELNNLFNASPVGIFAIDRDFRYLRINEPLASVNGPSVAEHIGKTVEQVLPKLWPKLEGLFRRVLSGESITNVEVSGETSRDPGEVFHWIASYFPLRGAEGQIVGMGGVAVDITRRKRAEEALRRSEARLHEAQHLAHLGSWDLDIATNVLGWSNEVYCIFELDPEQFGASYEAFLEAIHPDDRDAVNRAYAASLEARTPYAIDHRMLLRDGRIKHVHERCETFYDADGKPLRSHGTVQDITERKLAEESLHDSQQFVEKVLDTSPNLVWVRDRKGRTLLANSAYAEFVGLPKREAIGREDLLGGRRPEDVDLDLQMDREVIETGKTISFEREHTKASGEVAWLHTLKTRMLRPDGSVNVLGIAMDVTASKRAEAELVLHRQHLEELVQARTETLRRQTLELETMNLKLRELDRLKLMFIASMSHELRTPLNSIIGFTGIVLQGLAGEINTEQRKQLSFVKESAMHLLSLINDVIDISKIQAEKVQLKRERFDLSALVSEVAQSLVPAAAAKGLTLSVAVPASLAMESDRTRVRQILVNLVGNAVKFTDRGGIEVRVSEAGAGVEVAVHDQGIGIHPEQLERLFTAFSQIVTEGRPKEGSGLGLYLSQKLANLLGGAISVRSELGVGSTFTVALPRA